MGLSILEYTGDGKTDAFPLQFALGVLNKSDVTCRVGKEVDGTGQPAYREWSYVPGNDGMALIHGPVPDVGDKITFARTVSKTVLVNDYQEGSPLDEKSLDDSNKQTMMAVHEMLDGRGGVRYADLDMNGNTLRNIGIDKTDPTSVATIGYFQEVEPKLDELLHVTDSIIRTDGQLFTRHFTPFLTKAGQVDYQIDIMVDHTGTNLVVVMAGELLEPGVDFTLPNANTIRFSRQPAAGQRVWGSSSTSLDNPDITQITNGEIKRITDRADIESDRIVTKTDEEISRIEEQTRIKLADLDAKAEEEVDRLNQVQTTISHAITLQGDLQENRVIKAGDGQSDRLDREVSAQIVLAEGYAATALSEANRAQQAADNAQAVSKLSDASGRIKGITYLANTVDENETRYQNYPVATRPEAVIAYAVAKKGDKMSGDLQLSNTAAIRADNTLEMFAEQYKLTFDGNDGELSTTGNSMGVQIGVDTVQDTTTTKSMYMFLTKGNKEAGRLALDYSGGKRKLELSIKDKNDSQIAAYLHSDGHFSVPDVNNTSPEDAAVNVGYANKYLVNNTTVSETSKAGAIPKAGSNGKLSADWLDATSFPVGSVLSYTGTDVPAGFLRMDGQVISDCRNIYPGFWSWVTSNAVKVEDSEYNADVAKTGSCGKYVQNNAIGSVRLPTLTGFISGTITKGDFAKNVEAGLPNISGSLDVYIRAQYGSGAFNTPTATASNANMIGNVYLDNAGPTTYFDASRSSAVYGKSTTVTPAHIKYPFIVSVYSAAVPASMAQAAEFTKGLSEKADTSLGNIDGNIKYVVNAWRSADGNNWYRKYNDGYTEQCIYFTGGQENQITVNLLTAMASTNYYVNTEILNSGSTATYNHTYVMSASTSSVVMWKNGGIRTMRVHVCGY